jgi:hypothetical protein
VPVSAYVGSSKNLKDLNARLQAVANLAFNSDENRARLAKAGAPDRLKVCPSEVGTTQKA